jgi:phosphonate metabolism protein PhnN/1,5-bisphosphokinase (PRPP-forming)
MRGTLFLVVGPSGVGKDTLIGGARIALADDPGFVFAERHITRPNGPGIERHVAVDLAAYARTLAGEGYALAWDAHGFRYGIPRDVEAALAQGRHVVANVSRAVLDEARRRYPPVRIVSVRVEEGELLMRLNRRARETQSRIAARLRRADLIEVTGADVVPFDNAAPIAAAVDRFVWLLRDQAASR